MDRSSMSLSTALDHSGEEDGGETRHEPLVEKRGKIQAAQAAQTTQAAETKETEKTKEKSQEGRRKMNMFGSLRGKIREKASALLLDTRAPSGDATSDKAKPKTNSKTNLKTNLRVVANDKFVGAVQKSKDISHGVSEEPVEKSATLFMRGDYLVHPAHGVGYVRGVEAEEVAGVRLDMIAISFEQERMVVRVPTCEYENCGLRSVSSPEAMEGIYDTLKTKRRIRKTMWGRRAQEYDNKIRSGDPVRLAQVVRELYRGEEQPNPSYSERQYYQLALERLSREVAVVEKIEAHLAVEKLETILAAA